MHPGVQAEPFGVIPSAPRLKRPRVLVVLLAVVLIVAGAVYTLKATLWAAKTVGATVSSEAPPRPPADGPAAPAAEAALMVTAAGLGAGWYEQVPAESGPTRFITTTPRPTGRVQTTLENAHWTGTSWSDDGLLIEEAETFATPTQSGADITAFAGPGGFCHCAAPPTSRSIAGVTVLERTTASGSMIAGFSHGTRSYRLILGQPSAAVAQQFGAVVAAAVKRATQPATSG